MYLLTPGMPGDSGVSGDSGVPGDWGHCGLRGPWGSPRHLGGRRGGLSLVRSAFIKIESKI